MLRKTKTKILLVLISTSLAIGLLLSFLSCEHATPICPGDDDDDKELIGSSEGTIGDSGVSTRQKLYRDADGEEIFNLISFYDNSNSHIGDAELTAAADIVRQINLQIIGLSKKNSLSALVLRTSSQSIARFHLNNRSLLQISSIGCLAAQQEKLSLPMI